MDYKNLSTELRQEFLGGWKPFEVIWLSLFVVAQLIAYALSPDSLLAMISGIAGILCVVFVSKGKVSNYFFGLIFAYTYFYIAWGANLIGEMNTVLYVYIPAQFIGYFVWKANLQKENGADAVIARGLTPKGWIILLSIIAIATLLFIQALKAAGGSLTGLDGVTTVTAITAQILMILRYKEQWLLWIVLNTLSIVLWLQASEPGSYAIPLMYIAYLLNSVYGYYNWTKLQKSVSEKSLI